MGSSHPPPEDPPDPSGLLRSASLCVMFSVMLTRTFGSSPDPPWMSWTDGLPPAVKVMSSGDLVPASTERGGSVTDTEVFMSKVRSWREDAAEAEPEGSGSSAASPLCSAGSPGSGSSEGFSGNAEAVVKPGCC